MAEKQLKLRSQMRQIVSIAIVIALSAVMFSASAKLNAGTEKRHPEDFAGLVRLEASRQNDLQDRVTALQSTVDSFTEKEEETQPVVPESIAIASGVSTGTTPVQGGGVRVELSDAPQDPELLKEFHPDQFVVHQDDLQAVISALWEGGAETMTLQGQRVTPLSAFRCVGNVLLLHGQVYSPPYVVEAIGDQDRLTAALENSRAIEIYKQYVSAIGLGWKLEQKSDIQMPAANNIGALKYASVPDDVDVWSY